MYSIAVFAAVENGFHFVGAAFRWRISLPSVHGIPAPSALPAKGLRRVGGAGYRSANNAERLLGVQHVFIFCRIRDKANTESPYEFLVAPSTGSARVKACQDVKERFPAIFKEQSEIRIIRNNTIFTSFGRFLDRGHDGGP